MHAYNYLKKQIVRCGNSYMRFFFLLLNFWVLLESLKNIYFLVRSWWHWLDWLSLDYINDLSIGKRSVGSILLLTNDEGLVNIRIMESIYVFFPIILIVCNDNCSSGKLLLWISDKLYFETLQDWLTLFGAITAWIKIQGANSALIRASLKTENRTYNCIGTVLAKNGCWSFLKGGFVLDSPSNLALLLFQVNLFSNQYIFRLLYVKKIEH